jgi:hypothetical protein
MLNPDQLRAMSDEDRTQLFERLVCKHYGTALNWQTVADDFGMERTTVFNWRKRHNVPFAVIYALDAWTAGPNYRLEEAAQLFGQAAAILAQVSGLRASGANEPA